MNAVEPLSSMRRGCTACVHGITNHTQGSRLREMGLCEGQDLEVLCAGNPMICRVGSCRVGIDHYLAAHIQVVASAL